MANISSSNSLGERVPKLRFPGFEGGWVCEKLSDFTERVTRKNTNNETELPLTISSKDGLVDQISYFNKTVASKDMSGYYLLKHGEYAYNKSYSVGYSFGSIKRLDRYAMGALSTLYICFTLKKHNTDFVNTYFDSLKWYHEIHMISAEGARNHGLLNIPTEVFFETKHWLPINLDEQEKIAKFFQLLEHKIEIQQNLLDALKLYKRGLLSKLFPQKGESVPQYRFTGFTDAWEQRKLGELASSFEYGLNAAAKEYDGKNKYIRITDIDDISHEFLTDEVTSPDIDLSISDNYRLSVGDILFARTGASVGKTYIYKASDGLVYYAGFLIRARIKKGYNPEFVFQNTLTANYEKYITVTSQRSGQPGVNAQEYSEYKIMVPSKAEQDKISTYLRSFDHLIILYQKKYDFYEKEKLALLQQMFI